MDNGITQTGHQVFATGPLLVIGDQVGLHKYRATIGEPDRGRSRKGDILELIDDIDAIFIGQLMQETAGAGSANLVHVEIQRVGIDQRDVFGVLAADFENGVHLRVHFDRPSGVSRDFIDD